jgi:hypothetical protein
VKQIDPAGSAAASRAVRADVPSGWPAVAKRGAALGLLVVGNKMYLGIAKIPGFAGYIGWGG